jgi:hypothetical protein
MSFAQVPDVKPGGLHAIGFLHLNTLNFFRSLENVIAPHATGGLMNTAG